MCRRTHFSVSFVLFLSIFCLPQAIVAQSAATLNDAKAPTSHISRAAAGSPSGEISPDGVRNAVDLTRQGVTLVDLGLFEAAAPYFEKAAQASKVSPTTWLNLSIVYYHLERYSDALASARQALRLDNVNRRVKIQVCNMTNYSKHYREALACFAELEKTGKLDDQDRANYGMAAIGSGDLSRALSLIGPIAAKEPYNATLQNALGVISYNKKDLPQAIAYFKRAIETDPGEGLYRYNMAIAQMSGKNRAAVLSQYHLLEGSNPDLAAKLRRIIFGNKLVFVNER